MRVAATILLCLLFAADAHAATVSVSGATLNVAAAPGEANQIAIAPGTGVVSITDAAPLTPGDGCVAAGAALECVGAVAAVVDLGDGDDTLTTTAALPLLVTDGDGADRVTGGTATDVFIASPGADRYQGGGGTDLVSYAARSDAVVADVDNVADDGAVGEGDDLRTDVELVAGGSGDDTLAGDGSADVLAGGPGDDDMTGGGGDDRLDGGPGADTLAGGSGTDTADYSARTEPLFIDLANGTAQEDAFVAVENATGGAGADRLIGTTGANQLLGGPGDDMLDGRTGADRLEGGAGTDSADYTSRTSAVTADLDGNNDDGVSFERDRITADVERLLGGSGSDVLTGNDGPNVLAGGAGNDRLDGNGGDDVVDAGTGDDRAWGDAGNDSFALAAGKDQAWGGDGNDTLCGGDNEDALNGERGDDHVAGDEGSDTLTGGDGIDLVTGAGGDDDLKGDGGTDTLTGGDGDDALSGDAGDDVLDGSSGADSLSGGDGTDRLLGSDDDDGLDGGPGDDGLDGGAGNDRLNGAVGADTISGDAGDDALLGDGGGDRLYGGDGADSLSGGFDDDVLTGGPGGDELNGDEGWDTVDYTGRPEALTIDLDEQRDDGAAGEGDNVRTSVETVIAGAGNDRLTGSAGSNYLYGEGGADRIDGAAGSDRLYGGAGRDTVIGGAGPDALDGGDGADRLVARDGAREAVRCGSARDRAITDIVDMLFGCEKRTSGTANWSNHDRVKAGRVRGVRARTGGGRFVDIPGFPGERIDRRLLRDIAYLQRKYKVYIADGYARTGHARHGEHPIGLAVDIVPGPGGSWSDVDRLAKWAEPRQNRPRSPFRWVGYNGDRNHGHGNHLHLSWRHTPTRRGRPARTVWTLALAR